MSRGIAALVYVSASELAKVMDFSYEWADENRKEFEGILFGLGIDTSVPYEEQREVWHRNRFNEVVFCDRYVGNERIDKEWIESGYASQEAKDKAKGSKLLDDLYRLKGGWE